MMWLTSAMLAAALALPQSTPYRLNEEALNLLAAGKDNEALRAASEAVSKAEAVFGRTHPATAMILRNQALIYARLGYYNRAEYYAKRSLAILQDDFGPADASLVPVINVLAETYASQGRYVEARKLSARAVAIGPEAGLHYAVALHNLAAVCEAEGRRREAERYHREAAQARESLLHN